MSESNVNPQKPESDDRSAKKKARSHRFWFWVAVLFFVWWFNNYTLKTTKVQLTSDKLVSPIRIAVISDQHASKYGISNDSIFRKIDKAKPDMVAVLGDMYSRGSEWELVSKPVELIQELTDSGYPVYFVTGDHDYYGESVISKRYIEAVKNTGAHVLDYKCEYAELNGNRAVYDFNNPYTTYSTYTTALRTNDEVASHYGEAIEVEGHKFFDAEKFE